MTQSMNLREYSMTAGANPNAAFGKVYYVDGTNGSNGYTGLTPALAKSTIASAIAASNVDIALAANVNNRNTIYINGGMFEETLATLPNQCDIVGVGARTGWQTLINGVMTITTAVLGCHFYNISFYQETAASAITIPVGSHGYGFYNCTFNFGGSGTHAITVNGGNTGEITDCMFCGDDPVPIGIYLTAYCNHTRIERNYINATTNGIKLAGMEYTDWGLLIKDNTIYRGQHSTHNPLTVGILFQGTESKAMVVHNYINATDAISFPGAYTNNRDQNMCIDNYVNQNSTATREDSFT